ncbi:MAG: hypothetical protein EX268_18060 [Deltaproteobacteria bacterium]|nr:MAG: hypothetical protein EX268_18060 [Deltaproteobacteria bacterium]
MSDVLAEAARAAVLGDGHVGDQDRRQTRGDDAVAVHDAGLGLRERAERDEARRDAGRIGLEQNRTGRPGGFDGCVEAFDDRGADAARDGALGRIEEELRKRTHAARVDRERLVCKHGLVDRDDHLVRERRLGRGDAVGATDLDRLGLGRAVVARGRHAAAAAHATGTGHAAHATGARHAAHATGAGHAARTGHAAHATGTGHAARTGHAAHAACAGHAAHARHATCTGRAAHATGAGHSACTGHAAAAADAAVHARATARACISTGTARPIVAGRAVTANRKHQAKAHAQTKTRTNHQTPLGSENGQHRRRESG